MIQLKITQPGSLLSVLHEQEITPAQVSIVAAILKAPDLTYSEVLFFLANRNQLRRHAVDSPAGAGESVEAFRG